MDQVDKRWKIFKACFIFFPKQCGTLEFLTVIVRARVQSRWYTIRVRDFCWPLQHKSSFISRCRWWKSRTKRLPAGLCSEGLGLLARRPRFLSYVDFLAGRHFRDISNSKRRSFRGRCRTSDTFTSAWQAWHFLHVAKTVAGVGRYGVFGVQF